MYHPLIPDEIIARLEGATDRGIDIVPEEEDHEHGHLGDCRCFPDVIHSDPDRNNTVWLHRRKM
jgi:hypothetical protein